MSEKSRCFKNNPHLSSMDSNLYSCKITSSSLSLLTFDRSLVNKLHKSGSNIGQIEFQRLVGKIEVLGELIIKNK